MLEHNGKDGKGKKIVFELLEDQQKNSTKELNKWATTTKTTHTNQVEQFQMGELVDVLSSRPISKIIFIFV